MLSMTMPPFKDWFFDRFSEWEKKQPGKRSTYSAFARWLSDNSYDVVFKQQMISYWIKGTIPTDDKYIWALAEKLGDEIYDVLSANRPDHFVTYATSASSRLNEIQKRKIEEQISKYLTVNEKEHSAS